MTDDAAELRSVLRGSLVTIRPGGRASAPLLRASRSAESVPADGANPGDAAGIDIFLLA